MTCWPSDGCYSGSNTWKRYKNTDFKVLKGSWWLMRHTNTCWKLLIRLSLSSGSGIIGKFLISHTLKIMWDMKQPCWSYRHLNMLWETGCSAAGSASWLPPDLRCFYRVVSSDSPREPTSAPPPDSLAPPEEDSTENHFRISSFFSQPCICFQTARPSWSTHNMAAQSRALTSKSAGCICLVIHIHASTTSCCIWPFKYKSMILYLKPWIYFFCFYEFLQWTADLSRLDNTTRLKAAGNDSS